MSEHPIAQKIIDELEKYSMWYEAFEHAIVRTSEEANAVRDGYTIKQGTKALIVRVKVRGEGKQFVMIVVPGDKRFHAKKAKDVLNAKDLRFANEDEVHELTGAVKPGGVPPFGNLFDLKVVCDPSVFDEDKLIFNAGRNYSIGMMSKDYRTLVQPQLEHIAE
ncbi:MAG: YbaK/EbsC family protein [Candidatus Saccharimonadales bacterium]|nr:YbaK/EbsC family protein [Candidatus Saccharimonadales bacterium]